MLKSYIICRRFSLIASMLLAMMIGITLGLISAYIGGAVETIMRIADVQISFPAILSA